MPLLFTLFFGLLFGSSSSDQLPVAVNNADGWRRRQPARRRLAEVRRRQGDGRGSNQRREGRRRRTTRGGAAHPEGLQRLPSRPARRTSNFTVVSTQGSSGGRDRGERDPSLGRRTVAVGARRAGCAEAVWATRRMPRNEVGCAGKRLRRARPVAAASAHPPGRHHQTNPAGTSAGQVPSGFVLSSPGNLVNFIMFSLTTTGVALIVERRNGTLQRLMTHARAPLGAHLRQSGRQCRAHLRPADPPAGSRRQLFFGVDYLRDPEALW